MIVPARTCPDCGGELPPGLPEGSCPNCLLRLGLGAATIAAASTSAAPSAGEHAGDLIGRFQLVEPIGEGGFGTVWLAEQLEPVRRPVALKIIKLGMDTREVVARFEAERQALALMDHPNIARVFDGGATEQGRPYFVMELVKGQRITDYCDAKQLSTEARLKLFIEVCQAVQHAHQKGVIHRDLKPSNVLVTEQDGRAVPKVIDFGIAKATETELTGKTLFTRFNQLIGTPAYMSPEQAGWGGLDVDTRSDVYSLGVLLYELLTGRPPFSNEQLVKAGFDQVLRIIREQDPPKPSTQISTLSLADQITVAQRRAAEPARLNRLVRGELDWIVMKCLEKDRARRYETANGLARELERHLNNEPVIAAAPSLGYQLQKFASKHRAALVTAAAFVLLLIAGVIVSTWQAVRANHFAQAERETRKETYTNWVAAQRSLYNANMNLAADAIRINSLGRAKDLLERHRPKPGEPDFLGWEWSFLLRETADDSAYSFHLTNAVFNRLGIAPDGKTLAVPSGDKGVQLWDVATRSVRGELPGRCFQAFFSPGSHWVATVVSQQGRVDVFNAQTGELVASLPRDDNVNDVAFSPDESLIAITSDERTAGSQVNLRLWRWRDKTLLGLRSFPSGHESFHYKVAFHPDGRRLALTQLQGGVRILRATDLTDEQLVETYDQGAGAVAISPNGRWLAVGVDGRENAIYLWDLPARTPPVLLRGHTSDIRALDFSRDSQWLASGSDDQTVKVWAMPQRRLRATLRGHRSDLRSVGFVGDGPMLVSGDVQAEIKFWDLNAAFTGTNDLNLPPLNTPLLTTNFQHFAGLNANGVAVFGPTYPAPAPREIPELGDKLRLLAMTPSGDHLASVDSSNTLRILRLADRHLAVKTNPHPITLMRLGFVKEGKFLVAFTDEGHVLRWTKDLEEVPPPNLPTNSTFMMLPEKFVKYLAFAIQEADFALCETVNGYRVFSLAHGRVLASPSSTGASLGGSALSRDGRLFAIGNADGRVAIYDTATWQRVGEPLNCHSDWITGVAFSPDGRRLATNGSGREPVRIWDLESRQQICTLPIEATGISFLQFSADGRSLAFATPAGQVRIVTVDLLH
jgi:eukaryotic-like serine/threonine-protein kinase